MPRHWPSSRSFAPLTRSAEVKLFRCGDLYLVYFDLDRGFVYDARDDSSTGDLSPVDYLGAEARYWLPVFEDDPIPQGLVDRLILKFAPRED